MTNFKRTIRSNRVSNPVPTCDAAHGCKWLCLPMPTPSDPTGKDKHCERVPTAAQLQGAYFTTTPGREPRGLRAAKIRLGR